MESKHKKAVFIMTMLLVLLSIASISYYSMGETVEKVDTNQTWNISNSPLIQNDIVLDGYGNEEQDATYIYVEKENGMKIQEYSLNKIDNSEKYVINVKAVSGGSTNSQVLKASVSPNNVKEMRLKMDSGVYSTETCGCVVGNY